MVKFPNLVLPLGFICLACGLRQSNYTLAYRTLTPSGVHVKVTPAGGVNQAEDDEVQPCFTCTGSFTFIQLADPQFGMKNLAQPDPEEALNFDDEWSNLNDAVQKIKRLFPSKEEKENMFVVMSGDMQNFWSQAGAKNNMALNDYQVKGYENVGDLQAKAVKDLLHELQQDGIPVWTLPGNHDLDDKMTMADLSRYKGMWQMSLERSRRLFKKKRKDVKLSEFRDHFSFWFHEVMFIAIDSQLYYTDDDVDKDVEKYRDKQTQWIESRLMEATATDRPAKAVVILSHIPPFVGRYGEKSGWANWHRRFRKEVLVGTMYDPNKPSIKSPQLILCGHFHGNVRVTGQISGKPVEVVTSGSVGATMVWDGGMFALDNEYLPSKASEIAEKETGGSAFFAHIVLTQGENKTWMQPEYYLANEEDQKKYSNVPKRITTEKEMSGLRIVQFSSDGGYRHKWFTLEDFTKLREPFTSDCMTNSYSDAEISSESFISDDSDDGF